MFSILAHATIAVIRQMIIGTLLPLKSETMDINSMPNRFPKKYADWIYYLSLCRSQYKD